MGPGELPTFGDLVGVPLVRRRPRKPAAAATHGRANESVLCRLCCHTTAAEMAAWRLRELVAELEVPDRRWAQIGALSPAGEAGRRQGIGDLDAAAAAHPQRPL